MGDYPNLFSEIRVGRVALKNRIVMPPMGTNFANGDGTLTPRMVEYYTERARGGVGLIIVEAATVDYPRGRSMKCQLTIDNEYDVPRWIELADKVHSFGTKIIVQLHHAGFTTYPEMSGGFESVTATNTDEIDANITKMKKARAMTTEEADEIVEKFIKAAVIAKQGKLDGVEVHCAHSYLLNDFLSPLTNKRTDKYGGGIEKRTLIATSIIRGIREACGDDFLISVRLPAKDFVPGGITFEESAVMANLMEAAGADLFNISVGFLNPINAEPQSSSDGCRLFLAEAIKSKFKKAKAAIHGKINSPEMAERVIAEGIADLVILGRQIICDPFWPAKVEEGREDEIRRCISCNEGCLGNMFLNGSGIRCVLNPYVGFEEQDRESFTPPAVALKKVVVAGGGIAGMQAAITAAKRGHKVILLEKSNQLGGQMLTAAKPPFKGVITESLGWFTGEMKRLDVDVRLETEATIETISQLETDAVIVAIGSEPNAAPIPGIEKAVESSSILNGAVEVPKNKKIVQIGGGLVGCETAHYLIENGGNSLTILEILPDICIGFEITSKPILVDAFNKAEAVIETSAKITKIADDSVYYINKDGKEQVVPCDMVVYATGRKPLGRELTSALKHRGIQTYSIGDATIVGSFRTATRSAFDAAYAI